MGNINHQSPLSKDKSYEKSSSCSDPNDKDLVVCNEICEESLSCTESNCPTSNSGSKTSSLSNNDNNELLSLDALMDKLFINTHKSLVELEEHVRKLENDLKKQNDKHNETIKQLEKQNEELKTQNEECVKKLCTSD
ncbi:1481_t:CDS:2, partial [Gigaspora rosea]